MAARVWVLVACPALVVLEVAAVAEEVGTVGAGLRDVQTSRPAAQVMGT